jgi:hypothetical protein
LPGSIWSSPQSTATEGRYRSNTDDFIRPDSYTNLKFDKWFGMAAFNSKVNTEGADIGAIATAGFATKAGSVYIGGFYSGDFWTWSPTNNYSERKHTTAPAGGENNKTYDTYFNNINIEPIPVNNAAVIIGVADMGFRLTYRTNYQSFNESDIVVTGLRPPDFLQPPASPDPDDPPWTPEPVPSQQLYKNYQAQGGYIAPQIAWAMAKNLIGNGIRPYVTVDLVFERNYRKIETAGADIFGNSGERVVQSLNHFDPSFAAGLGGYHFYNKDGFRLTADLDYVLNLNIYNNEYSYRDGTSYKTAQIKGTFESTPWRLMERSYASDLLTPSLAGAWSADRLALRFKLNLPLTLVLEEQHTMHLDSANSLIRNGLSVSTTAFTFRPDLRLALQYKIIPDRLTLNGGARIQATSITLKTTDYKNYNNGHETSSEKMHEKSYADNTGGGSRFVSRFSLGATFNFTENAWVEAMTGVSNVYGDSAIDIFAPGGLFSFGSILVGLRF